MVSSVKGGEIVWCLLSRVAKNVVSFVHPGKNSLVPFVLHSVSVDSRKTERNNRLDIYIKTTSSRMSGTKCGPLHDLCHPQQRIQHSQL